MFFFDLTPQIPNLEFDLTKKYLKVMDGERIVMIDVDINNNNY